jgi:hypothetical protein
MFSRLAKAMLQKQFNKISVKCTSYSMRAHHSAFEEKLLQFKNAVMLTAGITICALLSKHSRSPTSTNFLSGIIFYILTHLFIYLTETETTVYGGNYSTVHEYY